MFACHEEIQKEKIRALPSHASVFDFLKSFSGSRPSPPVFLDIEGDDQDDSHRV
jgi:hypothetical protein